MVWNGGKWSKVEYSAPIKRGVRNAKPPIPISKFCRLYPKQLFLSNHYIQICSLYLKNLCLSNIEKHKKNNKFVTKCYIFVIKLFEMFDNCLKNQEKDCLLL